MMRRLTAWFSIWLTVVWMLPAAGAAQQAGQQAARPSSQFTFNATTELVLVNVTVKDSHGNFVKNLTKSDITILEDNKPQNISSFDFENVDSGQPDTIDTGAAQETIKGTGPTAPKAATPANSAAPAAAATDEQYKDRRLMVMYFDLTTMQPEDIQAAVESAENYVKKQMLPADLVSIVALGNSLQVVEDFTGNKDILLHDLDGLNPSASAGFSDGLEADSSTGTVDTDMSTDTADSFVADDTEFNVANADRSLEALMTISQMLAPIQQKKSLLYFSDGITRSGTDNELTLRSAVNAAVKANVSIYTMDARGLQAMVPGGSATSGSMGGSSVYTGASTANALNQQFAQQETIQNLANDTGGAAFLDSSDFSPVYTKVQNDTKSYYLIGYHTSNRAKDGKYRKITVKLNRVEMASDTIEARKGYFAPTDINHMSTADRQGQLEDELSSDTPDQTLPIYATDAYFSVGNGRYFVPVSLVIPGSSIPTTGATPKSQPSVDFAGFVEDNGLRQIGHVNDEIPIGAKSAVDAKDLAAKNLQYNTGFTLTPGVYHIRMAARENQIGTMGSFETRVTIPDLDAQAAKAPGQLEVSSVLVGNQLSQVRPDPANPLTTTGTELIPSVTKVFASNQHLYLYFEVYNPKTAAGGKVDVRANAAFYLGSARTFQTGMVQATDLTDARRNAVVFQMEVPLSQFKSGRYTLQINAIDEAGQRYAFPRTSIIVRGPAAAAGAASPSPR